MSVAINLDKREEFMQQAILQAQLGYINKEGGPFGCVIAKDNDTVAVGHNQVLLNKDCTCHGEIQAIRNACKALNSHDLSGCELYTTAYPCPMCLGAIKWANIKKVYYGCTTEDTEGLGFKDKKMYDDDSSTEVEFEEMRRDDCLAVFEDYQKAEHETY